MRRRIPGYLHHKNTGQARVIIDGKVYWVGKHGSPQSHDRYDELISKLVLSPAEGSSEVDKRTVSEILVRSRQCSPRR